MLWTPPAVTLIRSLFYDRNWGKYKTNMDWMERGRLSMNFTDNGLPLVPRVIKKAQIMYLL